MRGQAWVDPWVADRAWLREPLWAWSWAEQPEPVQLRLLQAEESVVPEGWPQVGELQQAGVPVLGQVALRRPEPVERLRLEIAEVGACPGLLTGSEAQSSCSRPSWSPCRYRNGYGHILTSEPKI